VIRDKAYYFSSKDGQCFGKKYHPKKSIWPRECYSALCRTWSSSLWYPGELFLGDNVNFVGGGIDSHVRNVSIEWMVRRERGNYNKKDRWHFGVGE
jgi:hypothetical protein